MLKKTDLHNFADDNTITAVCDQLPELIKILETKENSQWDGSGKMKWL